MNLGWYLYRFERAASSRGYEGMGLGLYIVHQIVRALGGTINVTSVPDLGSTFTVTLPLCLELTGQGGRFPNDADAIPSTSGDHSYSATTNGDGRMIRPSPRIFPFIADG